MVNKIREIINDIREDSRGLLIYLKTEVYKSTQNPLMIRVIKSIMANEPVDYLGDSTTQNKVLNNVYNLLITTNDYKGRGLYYPLTSSVRINNYCNFNCVHCYVDKKKEQISLEQFKIIIDNFNDLKIKLCIITGGEPFLHPQLFDMLEYAKNNYDGEVIVNTNGSLLTDEIISKLSHYKLRHLHISLDGDEKTHNRIRRSNNSYSKVMEVVEKVHKKGIRPELLFTVMKWNLNCVPQCIEYAKKYDIKISFKRLIASNDFIRKNLLLNGAEVLKLQQFIWDSNYKKASIDTCYCDIKTKHKDCLLNTTQLCSVDVHGDIYICPFLHEKEFCLGNVFTDGSLREIYNRYQEDGAKFKFTQRDIASPCNTCKNYELCAGGCRADAFYRTGNYLQCDELCYYKNKNLNGEGK